MKKIDDFKLTDKVTVAQARTWMATKDDNSKSNLIDLIYHRFYNRYIKHVINIKSGFLIMAVSCLMIETLESFVQGQKNTNGKGVGKKMFIDFFTREQLLFPNFQNISKKFYECIRCGILHQAETTKGWRILRSGAYNRYIGQNNQCRSFYRSFR